MAAPVRGARILLTDDRGVRADMTASWLAQMGWETYVLDGGYDGALEVGPPDVLPKPDPSHRYRRPYEGTDVDTKRDAGLSGLGIRPGRTVAARRNAWVFCDLRPNRRSPDDPRFQAVPDTATIAVGATYHSLLPWIVGGNSMPIDTREELINALHEACEIEHGLLVQYLYAALSMKKSLDEGLSTHQQRLVRDWEMDILLVAREEMGHLAIVCNLLAAIGAPAKFDRPPMPRKIDYYPFPFDLVPFGDDALYRFLVFELPRGMPKPPPPGADLSPVLMDARAGLAPEPIDFKFIGELYAQIADGFRAIPEAILFIGPPEAQTDDNWSDNVLDINEVRNRQQALGAIENIIEDGEGTPTDRSSSHYNRFLRIRQQYFNEGRFAAARNFRSILPLAKMQGSRARSS